MVEEKSACPLCEGEAKLSLFTQDVISYAVSNDAKETLPTGLMQKQSERSSDLNKKVTRIRLSDLTEEALEEQLGIINRDLRNTLSNANSDFQQLELVSDERKFRIKVEEDQTLQRAAHLNAKRAIEHAWGSTPSDELPFRIQESTY